MEPDYLAQTDDFRTRGERDTWIRDRTAEAKAQGMKHGRVSLDPDRNLLLVEAWKVCPEEEGEPRWQFATGQLT